MKKLIKLGWVLGAIVVLVAILSFVFIQTLKPDYEGEKEFTQLGDTVEVYYDGYGIPHIYGQSEEDAFRALGYVHAQDRLWQMDLLRRIARGGLSEAFGKDLILTDKFMLSLGIDDASTQSVSQLDGDSQSARISQAYLDGVNKFIAEGPTPIEYYLTGLEKETFQIKDIYNSIGYMAFSFAMAHKTDPLLSEIKSKLGPAYLKDLQIDSDTSTVRIKNYPEVDQDSTKNTLSAFTATALKGLPLPQFVGSNSWVIGAEKTKSGKVILANDPHIGFAQPSVWYEAHVTAPGYEMYGYHLAGIPFPVLGHNREIAYGITMLENDDIDFYYEQTNPADSTQYKSGEDWASYEILTRSIKVKDTTDVVFSYKKTKNGPVLNGIANQVRGERPISMSWIYTQLDNKNLDAFYDVSHATDLDSFKAALRNIHAPGLNLMYGDAEGNVAWWGTAKLYEMPEGAHTKFVLNGSTGDERPIRYKDFSENPHAVNPGSNYVYSANNQPDAMGSKLYPGYYLPENRAKRIVELLEQKDDWDKDAVSKMITDHTSTVNVDIVKELGKLVDVKQLSDEEIVLVDAMSTWEGDYPLESVAATLYHKWIFYLLKNTFEDELGEELFTQFLSTHFHKRLIAPMVSTPDSVWWDNMNTTEVEENQRDIVNGALLQAIDSLRGLFGNDPTKWTWGRIHSVEHGHPIGQVASMRQFFNVGPFPATGTREVINNMAFTYGDGELFNVKHGPSTRRVIDFSDIENSISILPTGQSGNPFSDHYDDQAEMYVNGEFRKMMMNKEEIISTAESKLIFKPGPE
ncbi:penicillin acylase family protein [Muriicola sp. Z0-33]|uniref:penicillin acylase family protein n=1 Tax=Muriicola sp. Z0-33 TaxID=2816957 RepID=UPI00223737C2|nr:penicillin acylase family protein [Muriicola sp. Z0-33]MCW5515446.1 penicillin acylase family protein [Muriicola sp. Z0-33]